MAMDFNFDVTKFTLREKPPKLQKFGSSIALSQDGKYLVVGSPNASNVKTKYKQKKVHLTKSRLLKTI